MKTLIIITAFFLFIYFVAKEVAGFFITGDAKICKANKEQMREFLKDSRLINGEWIKNDSIDLQIFPSHSSFFHKWHFLDSEGLILRWSDASDVIDSFVNVNYQKKKYYFDTLKVVK